MPCPSTAIQDISKHWTSSDIYIDGPISSKIQQFLWKSVIYIIIQKKSYLVPSGFLKLLSIPFRSWNDISINHIVNLLEYKQHNQKYKYILIIVCRFIKMQHYIPITSLDIETMADVFLQNVYWLYGILETVISDWGSSFVSAFIHILFQRLETTLRPSSAFHPQTNRQTEIVNAWIEQYLRVYVNFY